MRFLYNYLDINEENEADYMTKIEISSGAD